MAEVKEKWVLEKNSYGQAEIKIDCVNADLPLATFYHYNINSNKKAMWENAQLARSAPEMHQAIKRVLGYFKEGKPKEKEDELIRLLENVLTNAEEGGGIDENHPQES